MATRKRGGDTGARAGLLGSLAHTPLAEVLRKIVLEELSGDLQVTVQSAIKTVYFDRGFVVFASSDLKSDRLGESMIEAGRISRGEFALASKLMKNTKRKLGQVLVEAGIVGDEEIGRHVAAQVNRIVLSLFSEKRGMYSFDERPTGIPVELMVSLSSYRILIEGVRRMSRKSLVVAGLPPLDTKVEIADQPPFSLDFEKLRDAEKGVLRAVGEGATIRQVVESVVGNEGVTLRACYGLLCGGVLKAETPDAPDELLRVQEETGTFVLSEIRQKVSRKKEEVAEARSPAPEPSVPEPRPPVPAAERTAQPIEPLAAPVAPSLPAAPAPEHVATPEPTLTAEPSTPTSGFLEWLTNLLEALLRFFGRLFGAVEPSQELTPVSTEPIPQPHTQEARSEPPSVTQPPSTAPPPEPEEPPTVGSVEVPSWSLKDASSDDPPVEIGVGIPSWSMKDDPSSDDAEVSIETLGTPSWSMKDDPADSNPKQKKKRKPKPKPKRRAKAAPAKSKSRVERPIAPKPPLEQTVVLPPVAFESEPKPEPKAENAPMVLDKTLVDLDKELFIEDGADTDAPSMLSQIPVESVEIDEASFEIEFEVEFDEESLVELAESEPADAPVESAKARAIESPEENVEAQPRSISTPDEESPSATHSTPPAQEIEADEEEESQAASRAREMRRIKQGGGESRLLRDVKLHFRMRDWEGAVPLLQQLVEISPGKALYRGMLARAMSRHPGMRKEAEEHFVEALRLSPQDPELHYWLGIYYKSFGLKARAVTEFRTTLRINPKHEGARKQLFGDGKKDESIGSVMKKFFG